MKSLLNDFTNALLEFDSQTAKEILLKTILENDLSFSVGTLIVDSLKSIGERWADGELALSQIYMTGRICEELIESIFPEKAISKTQLPKIAITTLGDYHLLCKKIVTSVLQASGFNIADYGHGMDVNSLTEKVIKNKIKFLLISTLMLPSALLVKEVRAKLSKANYGVKILVGGAPYIFDNSLYKQVGADAMGVSPADAIEILNRWKKIET